MLRRVPRARLLSSAITRKSYDRWDFLPRVEVASPREARAPPPPLPSPEYLDIRGRCALEYADVPPLEEALRGHEAPVTIVLVHGAPGSYNDFRHLVPVLEHHPHLRIIGINLPGYAGSKVAKEHYLEDISALPTAGLALEAVKTLCAGQEGSDSVFLVGHSFGAHTVINMAALHATERHEYHSNPRNEIKIRGMALLAPAGCRPHKVLRPKESAMVVNIMRMRNPLVNALIPPFVKMIYTRLLGFPRDAPPGHYVAGLVRAGTTDFGVIREQVDTLRRQKLPSLVAWSQNDEFMEEEIPLELARLCYPGPRLAFAGGGHNVQKTRAEQVAGALTKWIQNVLAEDDEGEQHSTQSLL
ncbi:Serine protease [Phytophthora cinnamomi]|uniref:Serine protease n=1 Tax=Phytophthora cinnamomi TaxID=4785 RepID=UPI00355A844C|nr:Serine protease [Phytophthora cinnamomi]